MPLRIDLKPGEKIYVGGAVLVNGDSRSQLMVLNDVPILREKDILTESDANTPCKRIYLAIQLMYMDVANLAEYHQLYWGLVKDVLAAAPSTEPYITEISENVLADRYYQALKLAWKLIEYEKELIQHVAQSA